MGISGAYTLWILSDCASAELIYIVPVSHLTPLLFKVPTVFICLHVTSYGGMQGGSGGTAPVCFFNDVSLTVRLSIIRVINQLNAQNLVL